MDDYHRNVTSRLKTARGHLDGMICMVGDDAWCPDIMNQFAAVQGMLEGTRCEVFRHHLERHVADAIRAGRGDEIVDERPWTRAVSRFRGRPSIQIRSPCPCAKGELDGFLTGACRGAHPRGASCEPR